MLWTVVMKVRDIMNPEPVTACESDALGHAHRLMKTCHIRHLPVVSDGQLIGIVSERDILAARARAEGDDQWWKLPVRAAMTAPVHSATPDDSLAAVAARLATSKIGALPVLDHGRLVGIVSVTDVLDAEARQAATLPTRTGYAR
ncbi:MAG TPA: CBS domain-containing protein [Kofleriaceae bacterium]|nr:CBS domain-containing protein [Kofleriaceae bacterium]